MVNEFHVRLDYTEAMLRGAVRTFMRRRVLHRWWLWLAAAALLLGGALIGWDGGWLLVAGLDVAGLALMAFYFGAIWRAHLGNTLGRLRMMAPRSADATFKAESMTVSSNLGSITLPWSAFTEKWELENVWLLFVVPNQFMTLPLADMSPEAIAFLREKLPRQ